MNFANDDPINMEDWAVKYNNDNNFSHYTHQGTRKVVYSKDEILKVQKEVHEVQQP